MTLSAYTILCLDQGYVNQFLEKGNISSTARNGLSTDPEQMLLIATPKLAAYTRGGGRYACTSSDTHYAVRAGIHTMLVNPPPE